MSGAHAFAARDITPESLEQDAKIGEPAGDGWAEPPDSIITKIDSAPYPMDALPKRIRSAVGEVQAFTKAPPALVASSALGAIAIALQGHANVRRVEKLEGPIGLFVLIVADSGERKSTVDSFFLRSIRDHEVEQELLLAPELARANAALAAWYAEKEGIIAAIKRDAQKGGKGIGKLREALADLEAQPPPRVRAPKFLRGDDTPESLSSSLMNEWPAAGVAESEAGVILGGQAMGQDSAMRNFALLNKLWGAETLKIGRKTTTSFVVRDVRLSLCLMVQEPALRDFFERSRGLARGTGFLSRFLIAWPESTQGMRLFAEPPERWPHLDGLHGVLREFLGRPLPVVDGGLKPPTLDLGADAKRAWVAFHDKTERELGTGGELSDVRDVASKAAENAARVAALFHILEHGTEGRIDGDVFECASTVVAWHLQEARRFYGELALAPEQVAELRLDAFLVAYCREHAKETVPKSLILQRGPAPTRRKAPLDAALDSLAELGRIRVEKDGRQTSVRLNPSLVRDGSSADEKR